MPRTRIGIIDLGTNSVRFDVHEISPGKPVRTLHRERLMVRLGQGLFLSGEMDSEAIIRSVEAFSSFKYTANFLQVQKITAIATSAVRQAHDRDKLIKAIKKNSGINLRVISGQEEARLIAKGILTNEKNLPSNLALVDIGGGSVEISLSKQQKLLWAQSFSLGTARLDQLFSLSSAKLDNRSRARAVSDLRKHINKTFEQSGYIRSCPKIKKLVGSSGTIKALARIQAQGDPKNKKITYSFIKRLVKKMTLMNRQQLLQIPGMDFSRADMILGGAVLVQEIMQCFEAEEIFVTEFALRDGILAEEVNLVRNKKKSRLDFHIVDLEERLSRSLSNIIQSRRVAETCQELFAELQRVHRLSNEWKNYLVAAAYLENAGAVISASGHAEHSFYIARNFDFPWFEDRDRECIAHLCLWHSEGKISQKDLKFLKNKDERARFLKAIAILRLANSLVWNSRATIKIKKVNIKSNAISLKVYANGSRQLVKLRVEARKKFFEQVFKKQLLVET